MSLSRFPVILNRDGTLCTYCHHTIGYETTQPMHTSVSYSSRLSGSDNRTVMFDRLVVLDPRLLWDW